jgi:RHH-type proline utilization regulon transcriptional repressor/proline dehydrogenase/delta 1-pyrroline-5-carboxylate dehydrogenase
MFASVFMQEAKAHIEAVKGQTISLEERQARAIVLAGLMLQEAKRIQTPWEKKQQHQLARMMNDPVGKVFTTVITDQCFRSKRPARVANQLIYTIGKYGIPRYLALEKRIGLFAFKILGKPLAPVLVPLTIHLLQKETSSVILPGEKKELLQHMRKRRQEGVRINLNHLGEAILGEEEAKRRLHTYLQDLADPHIEYISIKISTIYSQINLIDWQGTLDALADRLRTLYRAAMQHRYVLNNGTHVPKFINLDMEEYRDLHLTVALFCKVLDEPEFHQHAAGIVLQSYLPDSFAIQKKLTEWSEKRYAKGGAPIKIRIVKGANLAMEQVEAAVRLWPQAPYVSKIEVDANYKRMVMYGCQHAKAAHLGIASHNLFDIAYAMLLQAEYSVEQQTCFEMLEGMADHMRRVVQQLSGDMLLYCPAATKEEFQNAVAYLVRRLDENTAPENFLRHAFDLEPGSIEWKQQAELFSKSCLLAHSVSDLPRRQQNRSQEIIKDKNCFCNEPDTDWSLPQNQQWAENIVNRWMQKAPETIPLVIDGVRIFSSSMAKGQDPSRFGHMNYQYALATFEQIDQALEVAQHNQKKWSHTSVQKRMQLLGQVAQALRRKRADLIGVMVADTGKTIAEADVEVSEAIDFADYYRFNVQEWASLSDIQWEAKGTVLVAPPWNFPCSIPAGGILAALAAGNCVIFKPAAEAIGVGWQLVQILWQAGISPQVLQFIMCEDEPVGSQLIQDSRVAAVVLTGATATAKLFLKLRPSLDLMAETGGKNTMVISSLSDRDLAIKDLVQSAFGHAGQKCSACSLAILEAEVYDDPHFLQQLRDATNSLAVGSAWDLKTRVNPLIRPAGPELLRGLTQLEEGEEWLLKPEQKGPHLWTPGIKLGVRPHSFTFQTELFGPVLGLVRASDFAHALELMNQTPYGLTAGLHSLDEREQKMWLQRIEAGNCYINRTITGAVVQRQPFGGCKESSFGRGSKAGGPNYLTQLMRAKQMGLPPHQIDLLVNPQGTRSDEWKASLGSYTFYWQHYFSKKHDPSQVLGQDNFQFYVPHSHMALRVQSGDDAFDVLRVVAAAKICGTSIEVSTEDLAILNALSSPAKYETEQEFIKRLGKIKRVRLLKNPSQDLQKALAEAGCHLNMGPVLANGRLELLHYLREVSLSFDYHRYGNLGEREVSLSKNETQCGACQCMNY